MLEEANETRRSREGGEETRDIGLDRSRLTTAELFALVAITLGCKAGQGRERCARRPDGELNLRGGGERKCRGSAHLCRVCLPGGLLADYLLFQI